MENQSKYTFLDFIKFIEWWWAKQSTGDKAGTIVVASILFLIPGLYFFGIGALVVFFSFFIFVLSCWGILAFSRAVKEEWIKYLDERAVEAQKIVNRLRGSK